MKLSSMFIFLGLSLPLYAEKLRCQTKAFTLEMSDRNARTMSLSIGRDGERKLWDFGTVVKKQGVITAKEKADMRRALKEAQKDPEAVDVQEMLKDALKSHSMKTYTVQKQSVTLEITEFYNKKGEKTFSSGTHSWLGSYRCQ